MTDGSRKKRIGIWALAMITLVGMGLRLASCFWGYPMALHPDEFTIVDNAIDMLRRHGLFQYEISNFARAGFECHHNIGYWTQIPYMGLGLSAASMTGIRYSSSGMSYDRRTNPDSMKNYIHMLNHMDSVHSEKILPKEARFETMMLGLRLNRGIHDEDFQRMHGVSVEACYGDRLRKMMSKGLIQHEDHYWRLTSRGFDIQNSILVELME